MPQNATLRAIGFWRATHGVFLHCPRPQWLVRRDWHATERERIIEYLRTGCDFAKCSGSTCKGWSTCRFRGCREGEHNGSKDFTDGEWYWPEGLAHYIQHHAVMLPEEFIETMRANGWRAPDVGGDASLARPSFDYNFWIDWAKHQQRRPWYSCWRLALYRPAFSVERIAAGDDCQQIRALGARRHRSPLALA